MRGTVLQVVVVVLALSVVACGGCKKKDKKSILPPPPPDLSFLDDPGAPSAMYVTDPQGDTAFGDDDQDWKEAEGTYDAFYIYIRIYMWGITDLADVGGALYVIGIDNDRNGYMSAGDLAVGYYPEMGVFAIINHSSKEVHCQKAYSVGPGILEVAIPRGLCNPAGPNIDFECGNIYGSMADRMPNTGWVEFRY
jgi:hypothetical protein